MLCVRCNGTIAPENIDVEKGLALCRVCGELMRGPIVAIEALAPAPLVKPADFGGVEKMDGHTYEVTLPRSTPLVFLVIALPVPPLVFYGFWANGSSTEVLIVLGAFCLFLLWAALVNMINTRRLKIDPSGISFSNGPLPSFEGFSLSMNLIDDAVVLQRAMLSGGGEGQRMESVPVFQVNVREQGGGAHLIMTTKVRAHADYLAGSMQQAVEQARLVRPLPTPYRS